MWESASFLARLRRNGVTERVDVGLALAAPRYRQPALFLQFFDRFIHRQLPGY